jgi:signal transduction histidine kinase
VSDGRQAEVSESSTTGPVAWLAASPAASQARLPLSRASCLTLARLVLAGHAVQPAGAAAAFRLRGGEDPLVAAWLVDAAAVPGGVVSAIESMLVVPDPAAAEAAVLADVVATVAAQRREFEQQVAAARLEAMREFAYGAGHELNNPLANIATRAQSLLLDEVDPERRRRLATIVDQAFRGRDMIGGLMVFARPPLPRPERVAADTLVREVVEAVRPLAESRAARLSHEAAATPCEAVIDGPQVAEAMRLLLVNAVQASGGVTVACAGAADGSCLVTIDDDGPGLDAAALQRAFDPFSSGREAGRGLGLGLPKAWRLLEGSGCRLDIRPRNGRGLRVTIRLPAATPRSDTGQAGDGISSPSFQVAGWQSAEESSRAS